MSSIHSHCRLRTKIHRRQSLLYLLVCLITCLLTKALLPAWSEAKQCEVVCLPIPLDFPMQDEQSLKSRNKCCCPDPLQKRSLLAWWSILHAEQLLLQLPCDQDLGVSIRALVQFLCQVCQCRSLQNTVPRYWLGIVIYDRTLTAYSTGFQGMWIA